MTSSHSLHTTRCCGGYIDRSGAERATPSTPPARKGTPTMATTFRTGNRIRINNARWREIHGETGRVAHVRKDGVITVRLDDGTKVYDMIPEHLTAYYSPLQ